MDLRRRAALPLLSLALTALLLGLSPFCCFSAGQEALSSEEQEAPSSKGQETLSSVEQREEESSAGEGESRALSSGERGEEERPQAGESGTSENGGEREYRVGILQLIQHPALDRANEGFVQALSDSGLRFRIDQQNASGDQSACQTISDKFVGDRDDLIYAIATPAAQAAAAATTEIPIVLSAVTDPAASGLVQSNEHPGGNVTGTSDLTPVEKQMELLKKLFPETKTVGILSSSSEANSAIQVELAEKSCAELGLETKSFSVSSSNEIQTVTESMIGKIDVLYVPTDNMISAGIATVAAVTTDHGIPIIVGEEGELVGGGLATYGVDYYELGYLAGQQAISILKDGKKPGDIPIEQLPEEKLKLKINQDQAKLLGLSIDDELHVTKLSEQRSGNGFLASLLGAAAQGLIWSLMVLGVYITFRILNIADMTTDGSFTLGGCVCAMLMLSGVDPTIALLLGALSGGLAGAVTGILHTFFGIPAILAGILTQISLWSINLRIMANKSNQSVNRIASDISFFAGRFGLTQSEATLVVGLLAAILAVLLLYWFFGTEIGSSLRATGNNEDMIRALGVNTNSVKLLGLVIANLFVGLSGALVAQSTKYADVNMGTGAIVIGLAAIVIGEVLFRKARNFGLKLGCSVLGCIIYFMIRALVLRLGMRANDMKLLSALIVGLALCVPVALSKWREKKSYREYSAEDEEEAEGVGENA